MFDRVMRSGRTYDPGFVPEVSRCRTRKGKSLTASEPEALKMSEPIEEMDGKHSENEEKRLITFGSLPVKESGVDIFGLQSVNGRKGVALDKMGGVMVSPVVYQALNSGAPPIYRNPRYITFGYYPRNDTDARHEVEDSCNEADAPTEREDAPAGTLRAADRALGAELAPVDADRAPGTKKTPEAPENEPGLGLTCEGNDRVNKRDPQYVEIDSPSPKIIVDSNDDSRSSWLEEKCCDKGDPTGKGGLLEPDSEWYRDHWSRSDYPSASNYDGVSEMDVEDTEYLRVNAMIYKVEDNYVLDDDENEAFILRLQAEDRTRRHARSQVPSQTSGAGPSGIRRLSRASIEEVEDEDAPYIAVSSSDENDIEIIPCNKVKGKAVERHPAKRKARPSLGVALDDLDLEPERSDGRRSYSKLTNQTNDELPDGFRSGGYVEAKYGQPIKRSNRRSVSSVPQSETRRTSEPSSRMHRYSTATNNDRSTIQLDLEPSDNPSGSDSDNSNRSSDDVDDSHVGNASNEGILRLLRKLQKENKKLKAKSKKHARSGYKAQAPKTYKGEEPDIEEYEQFIFDYDNWVIETGLDRESAVRNVSRFLGGKAGRCYMAGIAPNLRKVEYKMKDVYKLLYAYCFPPDFKETLRKKYEHLNQGKRSVQDFFADLDLYRNRLNDITDAQHARRAWEGSDRYIRAEWANRGLRPERVTTEELKESALDIERAYTIKQKIKRESSQKDNYGQIERHSSSDYEQDYESESSTQGSSKKSENNWTSAQESETDKGSESKQKRTPSWQRSYRANKVNEQKDKDRREDRCFICHKIGHIARKCLKANTDKPTIQAEARVRASSAMLKELDEMHRLRDRIELSSVRVCVNSVQIHPMTLSKRWLDCQEYIEQVNYTKQLLDDNEVSLGEPRVIKWERLHKGEMRIEEALRKAEFELTTEPKKIQDMTRETSEIVLDDKVKISNIEDSPLRVELEGEKDPKIRSGAQTNILIPLNPRYGLSPYHLPGTGTSGLGLATARGISDFGLPQESAVDTQLRTFKDVSERGSVAHDATPSTVREDLPASVNPDSSSGQSIPIVLDELSLSRTHSTSEPVDSVRIDSTDVEMLDSGAVSSEQPPDGSEPRAPEEVQLGGSEGSSEGSHKEGKGKDSGRVRSVEGGPVGGGDGRKPSRVSRASSKANKEQAERSK